MGKKLIIKRSNKSTTLEQYQASLEQNKLRKPEEKFKTSLLDEQIDKRHRYKKHNQKLKEIDIHIANRI